MYVSMNERISSVIYFVADTINVKNQRSKTSRLTNLLHKNVKNVYSLKIVSTLCGSVEGIEKDIKIRK